MIDRYEELFTLYLYIHGYYIYRCIHYMQDTVSVGWCCFVCLRRLPV